MLGVSLVLVGLVPVAAAGRRAGPARLHGLRPGARRAAGCCRGAPGRRSSASCAMDFSTWIVAGLMIVVGAVWTIMYNADLLLSATARGLRPLRAAGARSCAWRWPIPLAARFRTGVTLPMFTLVVFTLVTGAAIVGLVRRRLRRRGGVRRRLRRAREHGRGDARRRPAGGAGPDARRAARRTSPPSAASPYLPVEARQLGTGRGREPYPLRGLDDRLPASTRRSRSARWRGATARRARCGRRWRSGAAWRWSTASIVPRRDAFGFSALPPDFQLTGFLLRRRHLRPDPGRGPRPADRAARRG